MEKFKFKKCPARVVQLLLAEVQESFRMGVIILADTNQVSQVHVLPLSPSSTEGGHGQAPSLALSLGLPRRYISLNVFLVLPFVLLVASSSTPKTRKVFIIPLTHQAFHFVNSFSNHFRSYVEKSKDLLSKTLSSREMKCVKEQECCKDRKKTEGI